jgi:hypothetical protein
MKRYLSLFSALFAIICIASCTKSDKIVPQKILADSTKKIISITPPIPQKTLIGRWDMTSEQFVKYLDGTEIASGSGQSLPYSFAYVIFNSDSTYTCSAADWYPALSTYGVLKDDSQGSFKLSADTVLTVSTYLAGLNTVNNGVSPNAPPIIVPVSDKITLRQFTDTTLVVHHEYVFNCTDASAGPVGAYKIVWDLSYAKSH